MKLEEVLEQQKLMLEEKNEEIRKLQNQIEFLENCIREGVSIEVHEVHTFAVPEDVNDLKFGD